MIDFLSVLVMWFLAMVMGGVGFGMHTPHFPGSHGLFDM